MSATAEHQRRQGDPRGPRGLRERPRPHHPDPAAGVRGLQDRGGQVPGWRHARRRVHQVPPQAGRLRPAPARRADDPREAALRRGHARAAGELRGGDREVRPASQGPHHDPPEHPDAPHPAARRREGDPRAGRGQALQPRGLRQHRAQRHRRPLGGRGEGRAVRPHPLRGRVRALLRAPSDDAGDAAQDQDRLRWQRQRAGDQRRSTTSPSARASSSRGPTHPGEVRGVQMLVGGGTSIMPRVAPVLYEFVELDNGDYLRIAEAVFRIFDRQEWLRVNRARARIKVFVDKYGIDELRAQVEEELKGEWVAERDFGVEHRLFVDDEESSAPRRRRRLREPQRRSQRVRALPRRQRAPSRSRRASSQSRRRSRAATSRPSSSAGWRRSCASTPAATRAPPCSRTSCCAGCARRASTTSGRRCASWASATRARGKSTTSSPAPAPTPASSGSRARWASTRRCRSASRRCT